MALGLAPSEAAVFGYVAAPTNLILAPGKTWRPAEARLAAVTDGRSEGGREKSGITLG
jgi:hypothetical protein